MAGVNKVILIGNLGNDPDMRYMSNGEPIANISVATSETWNDRLSGEKREKVEWHRVVAFRKLAEIIGQYCRKGSKVYIEGKLQTRKWVDQSGQDRYMTEIVADQLQMLDSRNSGGSSEYGKNYQSGNDHNSNTKAPAWSPATPSHDLADQNNDGFDSDIPF